MSLLWRTNQRDLGDTNNQLIPARSRRVGTVSVSQESALRHSAVWACIALRADLVSTLPVKVYRQVGDFQVDAPPTPFLTDPAGDGFGITDWLYSSEAELARAGNVIGVILNRDGAGYPAQVQWQPTSSVAITGKGPTILSYRIGGTTYEPSDIWHERQYVLPGVPLGLSPIAYAAWSIGSYLSAQQFGLDWFGGTWAPTAHLKNIDKTVDPVAAQIVKDRYKASQASRDLFVTGKDWELDLVSINANESQFLETMNYGITDVCRFLGIPGDLVDAEQDSGAKITYANITQRNLQLLVMKLGPIVVRRETKLSTALPKPRSVRLDTDALLRMDPSSLQTMLNAQITARQLAPSEARAINNRPPFTADQLNEFDRLFPKGSSDPTRKGAPTPP